MILKIFKGYVGPICIPYHVMTLTLRTACHFNGAWTWMRECRVPLKWRINSAAPGDIRACAIINWLVIRQLSQALCSNEMKNYSAHSESDDEVEPHALTSPSPPTSLDQGRIGYLKNWVKIFEWEHSLLCMVQMIRVTAIPAGGREPESRGRGRGRGRARGRSTTQRATSSLPWHPIVPYTDSAMSSLSFMAPISLFLQVRNQRISIAISSMTLP